MIPPGGLIKLLPQQRHAPGQLGMRRRHSTCSTALQTGSSCYVKCIKVYAATLQAQSNRGYVDEDNLAAVKHLPCTGFESKKQLLLEVSMAQQNVCSLMILLLSINLDASSCDLQAL